MKFFTTIFMIFLLVIVYSPSFAQISVGVLGGINLSDFKMKDLGEVNDVTHRSGYGMGLVLDYSMNRNISLSVQPIYLQKNAKMNQSYPDPDFDLYTSFLEVPFFIKMYVGKEARSYIMAGPTLGFLLDSEVRAEAFGLKFKGNLDDAIHHFDYGVSFGAGISIPINRTIIFFEGRYTYGLKDLGKTGSIVFRSGDIIETTETDGAAEIKSRGLQFMTGISVPLRKY